MHSSLEYILLPSIKSSRLQTQTALIDLKNQYSILNRFQKKNHLLDFSKNLEAYRLPKIKRSITRDKQNQNIHKELSSLKSQLAVKNLQNKFDLLSSMLQSSINRNTCTGQCIHHQQQMPIIMPMPFQMMHQYQPQFPQYSTNSFNNPYNQQQKPNQNSIRNSSPRQSIISQKKIQKKKKTRKELFKTFRKYAYAVYFCIFLKYYSVKFSKNRFQLFKQNYIENNYGKKIEEESFKIMKSLQVIDIVDLVLTSPDFSQNSNSTTSINQSKKSRKEKSTFAIYPKDPEKLFIKSLNFVKNYLDDLQKIILREQFIQYYYEIIGIGSINQSFVLDDLLTPQQIQLITFSQKKGFMIVTQTTQIILLMIYMFAKQVIYNILLKLPENRVFAKNVRNDYPGLENQMPEIMKFIDYATKVFYCICNNMYINFVDLYHPKSNYDRLKTKFKIQPALELCAPGFKKRQQSIDFEQLILGIKGTDQIYQKVQKNQKYGKHCDQIQKRMKKMLQTLRVKVKAYNHHIYQFIRDVTLDQKFLIFEGKQTQEKDKVRTQRNIQKQKQKYKQKQKQKYRISAISSKYPQAELKSRNDLAKSVYNSKYQLRD